MVHQNRDEFNELKNKILNYLTSSEFEKLRVLVQWTPFDFS